MLGGCVTWACIGAWTLAAVRWAPAASRAPAASTTRGLGKSCWLKAYIQPLGEHKVPRRKSHRERRRPRDVHPTPWRAPSTAPATQITPAERRRPRDGGGWLVGGWVGRLVGGLVGWSVGWFVVGGRRTGGGGGEGGEEDDRADTTLKTKTKTPHVNVGNKFCAGHPDTSQPQGM